MLLSHVAADLDPGLINFVLRLRHEQLQIFRKHVFHAVCEDAPPDEFRFRKSVAVRRLLDLFFLFLRNPETLLLIFLDGNFISRLLTLLSFLLLHAALRT